MRRTIIILSIILAFNIIGIYYNWYLNWWWFDIVSHFLGGFFIAMLMADYLKGHFLPGEIIKNILIIVGATIFIGVVWEFCEYIANQTLIRPTKQYLGINAYFMGDLDDTVTDMMLDIVGSFLFAISYLKKFKNIS